MNGQLRDPQDALPQELFTHLISSLHPRSIATTSAVCSRWRRVINGTPSIHQEIDLSHLTPKSIPHLVLLLLRQSALSQDRVTKVKFNFPYDELEGDFKSLTRRGLSPLQRWESSMVSMPFGVLERSRPTLREISLNGLGRTLVLQVLQHLETYPNLLKISILTEGPLTLQAGKVPLQKRILIDTSYESFGDFNEWIRIMRLVRHLSGTGMTVFKWMEWGGFDQDHLNDGLSNLLEELLHSTSTLTKIRWLSPQCSALAVAKWMLWQRCSNLTDLAIRVDPQFLVDAQLMPVRDATLMPIDAPETSSMELEFLHLVINGGKIQWNPLARLIGTRLTHLTFKIEPGLGRLHSLEPIWSFDLLSFMCHFSQFLKKIEIEMRFSESIEEFKQPYPKTCFSKLQTLFLERPNTQVCQFFTDLDSPNLSSLTFLPRWSEHEEDEEDEENEESGLEQEHEIEAATQIEFDCLMALVKKNCSGLEEVITNIYFDEADGEVNLQQHTESLIFPKLSNLELRGLVGSVGKAFQSSHYPNLLNLYTKEAVRTSFSNVPASLGWHTDRLI